VLRHVKLTPWHTMVRHGVSLMSSDLMQLNVSGL